MPAPLAYQMFKAKTEHPLHAAIRAKREDVVFLYLVEHDAQVGRFHSSIAVVLLLSTFSAMLHSFI